MIPNLLTAINFKNTLYCVLRYLQDFPHNIPQRTSTTCLNNNNTVKLQTLNTEHFLRIFLPSLFGALLETCLHCARTVELLERKAIREKRPRQILNFHCWNRWNINSSTQTTEKNPQKVNLMPIISRSNKWQVCRIHLFSERLVSGWGEWIY